MKILCTGDLHLGAGTDYGRTLRGEGSRLADQADLWRRVCRLAVEEECDALLFAGDAFHRPKPSPSELLAFRSGLDVLSASGVAVIAIPGNHDVSSVDEPSVLQLFGTPVGPLLQGDIMQYASVPMVKHAASWPLEGLNVAMLPWSPTGRLVASAGGGDRDALNRDLAERLVLVAHELRAECDQDAPALLMLHWSVSGSKTAGGEDVSLFREPVLPYADLAAQGWDFIVAGHIHRPQTLGDPIGDRHFYVGSPGVVNFGEAALEHGVWLLEPDNPHWSAYDFRVVTDRPFVTLDADLTAEGTSGLAYVDLGRQVPGDEVLDAVVRVRYTATPEQKRRVDEPAIRRALLDAGAHKVYAIEANITREGRARAEHVDTDLAPLAALDAYIDARQIPRERAQPMRERTETYLDEGRAA